VGSPSCLGSESHTSGTRTMTVVRMRTRVLLVLNPIAPPACFELWKSGGCRRYRPAETTWERAILSTVGVPA
jgi:hypothetical protein